ncbi:hypothetical protein DL96DRAFT_1707430 [Flagelloscypha sp. PMI_526]|nr:hypothetical protein DL96DRAFT_1707430 [Flagelloscypha sp. PMI_526]
MSAPDIEQDGERKRFEGFSMPMNANRLSMPPLPTSAVQAKKKHGRSHSRNLSLSLPPLGPLPLNGQQSPGPSPLSPSPLSASPSVTPTTPGFPGKRSSHHRRLSSVSTRHESAEIMGVPHTERPTELDPSKDSVRRRALLALEGKPDSYREVEIPQLLDDNDPRPFEFPTKPSFPPGPGLGSAGSFKRDSFKLLAPTGSNKDTLGTLAPISPPSDKRSKRPNLRPLSLTPESLTAPVFAINTDTPPATSEARSPPLRLKALSLAAIATLRVSPKAAAEQSFRPPSPSTATTDESFSFQSKFFQSFRSSQSFRSDDDATDAHHPGNSFRAAKESLLSAPVSDSASPEALEIEADSEEAREEMEYVRYVHPASAPSDTNYSRARPELSVSTGARPAPSKRSSISYKSSDDAVEHRLSTASSTSSHSSISSSGNWFNQSGSSMRDDDSTLNTPASSIASFPTSSWSRRSTGVSLSASEQHFLFKSHSTLLARIQDLEKALSVRQRDSLAFYDRPISVLSTTSSYSDDELAQLRAERDELKSDVAGWRTRVADLEKQLSTLASRVELERREAWVARSRVGLLDAEKTSLERLLNEARSKADEMQEMLSSVERGKEDLSKRVEDLVLETKTLEMEKISQSEENAELRRRIEELEKENEELKAKMASPSKAFAFGSLQQGFTFEAPSEDSSELSTPYEADEPSLDDLLSGGFDDESSEVFGQHLSNKAFGVPYELELSDEENELAGYEDDEEDDLQDDMTSSSYGSPIAESRLGEMSEGWTFPRFAAPQPSRLTDFSFASPSRTPEPEEEHFMDSPDYSLTSSFDAFKSSLRSTPEDAFVFATPAGVGSTPALGTVLEEEEEEEEDNYAEDEDEDYEQDDCSDEDPTWDGQDEDVFGDVGGIKIMLTPADAEEPVSLGFEQTSQEPQDLPVSPIEEDIVQPAAKSYRKPAPIYESEDQATPTEQPRFQTPPKPRPISFSRLPRAVKSSASSPTVPREHSSSPKPISPTRIPQKVGSPTFYKTPRVENGSSRSNTNAPLGLSLASHISSAATSQTSPTSIKSSPTTSASRSPFSFMSFWSSPTPISPSMHPTRYVLKEVQLEKLRRQLEHTPRPMLLMHNMECKTCCECSGPVVSL